MAERCERGDLEAPNLREGCTPGIKAAKRCERGDIEAPHLREGCTPGIKAAKRCERGDLEAPHLREGCTPRLTGKHGKPQKSETVRAWRLRGPGFA